MVVTGRTTPPYYHSRITLNTSLTIRPYRDVDAIINLNSITGQLQGAYPVWWEPTFGTSFPICLQIEVFRTSTYTLDTILRAVVTTSPIVTSLANMDWNEEKNLNVS